MKINQHTNRSSRKWVITLVVILVLAIGVFVAYKFFSNNQQATNTETRPVNSVDYGPPTQAEQQEQAESKKPAPKPEEEQQNTSASVLISRAGQVAPGYPVAVRTIVDGISNGTCEMTFSKDSTTFSKTFEIKSEATTYTCNGDIETSNFNASGDWTLMVTVVGTTAQTEGTVHVEK